MMCSLRFFAHRSAPAVWMIFLFQLLLLTSTALSQSPVITTQPFDEDRCAGQLVTFRVEATGSNLQYQWRKSGAPIQDATKSFYTIFTVKADDSGSYDVIVSNPSGTTTSKSVALNVFSSPKIVSSTPTGDILLCTGQPLMMSVTATGASLQYQWMKGGVAIPGATNATYRIPAMTSSDYGSYSAAITGTCGSAGSQQFTVERGNVQVTAQPVSVTKKSRSYASFNVAASGSNLNYQWVKDGKDVAGATNSMIEFNQVNPSDSGLYYCRVSNTCGSVQSDAATLTVTPYGPDQLVAQDNFNFVHWFCNLTPKNISLPNLIRNTGDQPLIIQYPACGPDLEVLDQFPMTIQPGMSATLNFRLKPTECYIGSTLTFNTYFDINSNANPHTRVDVTGKVDLPTWLPFARDINHYAQLPFDIPVGSYIDTTIYVCNNLLGEVPVDINSFETVGTGFEIIQTPPLPIHIANKDQCFPITIRFRPPGAGLILGGVNITSSPSLPFPQIWFRAHGATKAGVNDVAASSATISIEPNPMHDGTHIRFAGMPAGEIDVCIVDVNGRTVKRFATIPEGTDEVVWDGNSGDGNKCSNGVYRVVIRTKHDQRTLPLVLMK